MESKNQRRDADTEGPSSAVETFDPPVDIVTDPPGSQAKCWPDIEEVRYGEPRSCDVQLIPQCGGPITTNPAFIRVADDDPHDRSVNTGGEQ